MTFRRGQPVQCVDSSAFDIRGYGDERYPTQGETYTVRDIVVDDAGTVGLLLYEIRNDRLPYQLGGKIVDFEKPFAAGASSRWSRAIRSKRWRPCDAQYNSVHRSWCLRGQSRRLPAMSLL